jgi:hypothetical protein
MHGEGPLGGDYQIIEERVRAGDLFTDGDIHEWGYTPEPQTPAQRVAGLLSSGRADEVTDEMMAAADPQEMARLYASGATGMDLPMDEASRMARAREMGFTEQGLHGTVTGRDFSSFRDDVETYIAPNSPEGLDLVAQFSTADQGRVMPLMYRGGVLDTRDPSGNFAQRRAAQKMYDEMGLGEFRTGDSGLPSWMDTDAINAARKAKYPGIRLEERDWVNSTAVFNPQNIRSRFARFDPRLSHLSNLNAANASPLLGGAVLAAPQEQPDPLRNLRGLLAR